MEDRNYKAKLLIADDEKEIRSILQEFFAKKNFLVTTAATGREVIDKLSKDKPDIILLDLRIPDLDGEEVLQYIDENKIEVGIIIITGYPGQLKNKKLLNRAYDFIIKPFDLDYLHSTVLTKVILLCENGIEVE